jgi:hypothetical protein
MCTQRTRPFAERCFRRMPMTRERTSRLPETSLRCRAEHDSRRRGAGTVITLPGRGSVPRTRVRGVPPGALRVTQPTSPRPCSRVEPHPSGLALRAGLPGDARPVQLRVTCKLVSGFRAPGFRCAGPYACVTVAVTRAEACAESREERKSYAAGRHRRSRVMARCVQLPFGRVEGSTVRPAQALGTRPSGVLRPSAPRRSSANGPACPSHVRSGRRR